MIKKIINKIIQIHYHKIFKNVGINSRIEKPLRILGGKNILIGDNSSVMKGLRAEAISHYQQQRFEPVIVIGNHTGLGQNCHLISTGQLLIGDNVTISANVFISTCNHQYTVPNCNVSYQPLLSDNVIIGDYTFLGYGCVILPGVHLGKQCIVGANSVVRKGEYPDYSVIAGAPGKIIKYYDIHKDMWVNVKE